MLRSLLKKNKKTLERGVFCLLFFNRNKNAAFFSLIHLNTYFICSRRVNKK